MYQGGVLAEERKDDVADATVGAKSAIMDAQVLKWDIGFEIDEDKESYLDSSIGQNGNEEELSIPREVIADVVGRSRLVAELERPIKIGTYNELPAYLLRVRFAFRQPSSSWLHRIQEAEIDIEFEDAPVERVSKKGKEEHPAVAAFRPDGKWEGDVTPALVTEAASFSINAGYMCAGAEVGVEKSRTFIQKGRVSIHGLRGGGRHRNSVGWVIKEDKVSRGGVPEALRLPIIVARPSATRFSARVTIKAHYGFWRGRLARSIPVVGKNDDPLYFDPKTLEEMMEKGTRGVDGTKIAEHVGELDALDLGKWSSLSK